MRPFGTTPLLGFILLAGFVQILATVTLGLAPLEVQLGAQRVPWGPYAATLGLAASGLLALWWLRRRPILAAILFLAIEGLVLAKLGARTFLLGWASFGEVVAHHFIALLSFAACLGLALVWWRQGSAHRLSRLPAACAATASLLLLALHLYAAPGQQTLPHGTYGWFVVAETVAAVLWLGAAAGFVATRWRALAGYRFAALALLLPYVVRLALASQPGSVETLVPSGRIDFLLLTVVVAVLAASAQIRPRNPLGVRLLAGALSALAVALLYVLYRRTFGQVDDAVLGLTQSLLAFSPPYPGYVAMWKLLIVMVTCFLLLRLVYDALLDPERRQHGAALGVITAAGLGLTDPQLSLMAAAGVLGLFDALARTPKAARTERSDVRSADLGEILERLSERLEWDGPVVLHDTKGDVVSLRGERGALPIELRARSTRPGVWTGRLQLGLIGRDRAPLHIEPAGRGEYAIGRWHYAKGDRRMLESYDDELGAVLTPLPRAKVERWTGGVLVELGEEHEALGAQELEQVLDVLIRWLDAE